MVHISEIVDDNASAAKKQLIVATPQPDKPNYQRPGLGTQLGVALGTTILPGGLAGSFAMMGATLMQFNTFSSLLPFFLQGAVGGAILGLGVALFIMNVRGMLKYADETSDNVFKSFSTKHALSLAVAAMTLVVGGQMLGFAIFLAEGIAKTTALTSLAASSIGGALTTGFGAFCFFSAFSNEKTHEQTAQTPMSTAEIAGKQL